MRKYIFLAMGILMMTSAVYSQLVTRTENFDDNVVSWSSSSVNGWKTNTLYFESPPNSYRGIVPNMLGDSIILQSPVYDFRGMTFVEMRFKHICKISPQDEIRIEYRISNSIWQPLPVTDYLGKAVAYVTQGFSAVSYTEWKANDSLAIPDNQTWWKEEVFDLSNTVGEEFAEFRFILKRGSVQGTQISYGWLLDDIEIIHAPHEMKKPVVELVSPFVKDTVYDVGPWYVNAKVKSNTKVQIATPWLLYTATNEQETITDSVLMTMVSGDTLWRGAIPQFMEGTDVVYTVRGRDLYANEDTVNSGYYIKRLLNAGDRFDYVYYSPSDTTTGAASNAAIIFHANQLKSWSRSLYLYSELEGNINPSKPLVITRIAWYNRANNYNHVRTDLKIYMEETNVTTNNTQIHIDPATNGSTLVYSGGTTTQLYWNEVTLDNPFILYPENNLMIYFEENSGITTTGQVAWAAGRTPGRTVYQIGTSTLGDGNCPLMRFEVEGINYDTNSAALFSINNPTTTAVEGILNPIVVTLHNKGIADLDSAMFYWTVNGQNLDSAKWKGKLSWNFKQQDTIGYFTAGTNGYNTLTVWISMPNGQIDSTMRDDTASVLVYSCVQQISGSQYIGKDKPFHSVREVIKVIERCGISGDITLVLDSGLYEENWDFTNLNRIMDGYKLNITSASGNPNDVILRPLSNEAIVLANTDNITIENITVDGTKNVYYTIRFTDSCNNVVINNCIILADTTTTSQGNVGIFKNFDTKPLTNICITNNLIKGGYQGIYFSGSTGNYSQNIIIDSNIVTAQSYEGFSLSYVNLNSVSYNRISSRSSAPQGTTWRGMYFNYVNKGGNIIGNRIRSENSGITTNVYGIYTNYIDTALVANNEIYLKSSATTAYGMYLYNSTDVDYIHNSVLVKSLAGNARAAEIQVTTSTAYNARYKNNLFAADGGSTPYAVYLSAKPTATFGLYNQINSNNYYSSGNLCYDGSTMVNLSVWKSTIVTDSNSINVKPLFVDEQTDLMVSNYSGMLSDSISLVGTDINNVSRTKVTTIGCYEGIPVYNLNGMLVKVLGLRDGGVAGQSDSLKLILLNTGNTPVTSLDIEWSINETSQITGGIHVTTSLAKGEIDTIAFGKINYMTGMMNVKVWLNKVNGIADDFRKDDTLQISNFICSSMLGGNVNIGKTRTYQTMQEVLDLAIQCGVSSDVTLILDSGEYKENWDFTNLNSIFNNYSLTITSASGDLKDVVLRPNSSIAIILAKSDNITIKNITIDVATAGTIGIRFQDACTNIVIRDCKIMASHVETGIESSCPIYKPSSTGITENISFINNIIDGGNTGFYFYAGTGPTALGRNIVFDSNIVQNSYNYATYIYYMNFSSISYNQITPRSTGSASTWYGLRIYNVRNGNIVGNRVITNNTASIYGIYIYNTDTTLVANNEVYINSSAGTTYGINTSANIAVTYLHNTVLLTGPGGSTFRALYINPGATNSSIFKNNIFVANGGTTPYAVYFNANSNLQNYLLDYNNYYSSGNLGYVGNAKADLAAWQDAITGDYNSVNQLPAFRDIAINLDLLDYSLYCDLDSAVVTDINGNPRNTNATMGCYEEPSVNAAALSGILNVREGAINGATDTLKVVFTNKGTAALNSVKLGWSINEQSQTVKEYFFDTPLMRLESDTIVLGVTTYVQGIFNVKIWINELEGGLITDGYLIDDTVSSSHFICLDVFSGTFHVGDTSMFASVADAFDAISMCGVGGDITLVLDSGLYEESWNFSNLGDIMEGNSLTITSRSGKAEDVVIKTPSGVGVTLNNTNNLTISAITINATSGSHAIQFTGACTNVVIRDCKILANYTATSYTNGCAIYKLTGTGVANNISFINNTIDGGYAGIYFNAGTGTTVNGKNIIIDSNTIQNSYYYPVLLYYADIASVSYNDMTPRVTGQGTNWHAIRFNYVHNTNVIGNRITCNNSGITAGVYGTYITSSDNILVANNEIDLNSEATTTYGLNHSTGVNCIHNTVRLTGTAKTNFRAAYITLSTAATNTVTCVNNIFVADGTGGTTSYAIYLSGAPAATFAQYNLIDYNNYYSSGNLGYAGVNQVDLTAWTSVVPTDLHSVNIPASFAGGNTLALTDYTGLRCNPSPSVPLDINGDKRGFVTAMGCYKGNITVNGNAALTEILRLREMVMSGDKDTFSIVLYNAGQTAINSVDVEWSVNGASQMTKNIVLSTPLTTGQSDTLLVDGLFYATDTTRVKIWLNNLDGGALTDEITEDDTLFFAVYSCSNVFSGIIHIGGAMGTYPSVRAALENAKLCTITGDITLALADGTYTDNWDFTNIKNLLGAHTLTITSANNDAEKVILRPASGAAVLMNNTDNLIIKAITIDATASGSHGIYITNSCTNVVVRDCKILASTAMAASAIYKPSATGVLHNFSIVKNIIDGGYAGVYLHGGTSESILATNLVLDSNTIQNHYLYGVYSFYADYTSIACNTILSRQSASSTKWYALRMFASNGSIVGNRIMQRGTIITQPYGIYTNYYNHYLTGVHGLIANNEIIIHSSATGIHADAYTNADVLHNSIYVKGNEAAKGIYIISSQYSNLVVKNNNIVMDSPLAYPVYVTATANMNQYIMDYNNMYAPSYVGYLNDDVLNIAAWQQTVTTDQHSVSMLPSFMDADVDLRLFIYSGLECDRITSVTKDILGDNRDAVTAMGCYEMTVYNGNGILIKILGLRDGLVGGQIDDIKVVLLNAGSTTLNSVNLEWSINGLSQVAGGSTFNISLPKREYDTITFGQITYPAGTLDIKVWINSLNGGVLPDENQRDDTLTATIYVCPPNLNGILTVDSTSGHFKSLEEAFSILSSCIAGDVILEMDSGTYTSNVNLRNIGSSNNYTITITSSTGNPSDVVLRPASGVAVLMNNTNNIILDAITIDARQGTYGVQLTGACSNIVINNCIILANPTIATEGYAPVYKAQETGSLIDMSITNSTIQGGHYGIYLCGTSNNYCQNITIDSNIISGQYQYATYFYYIDFNSVSYNRLNSRSVSQGTNWYGLYFIYIRNGGNIIGNRIWSDNQGINNILYGIRVSNMDNALVANNEIYLNSTATRTYGMNLASSHMVDYLHNTVLITGPGGATDFRAAHITVSNVGSMSASYKNNIFVANGGINPYAVYLSTPPGNNFTLYNRMNYNNYYSIGSLGFSGTDIPDLATWKSIIPSDNNSVSISPNFVDITNSLELSNYMGLICPLLPSVTENILGEPRTIYTTMGAYGTGVEEKCDIELTSVSIEPENISSLCVTDFVPVMIKVTNQGVEVLDFAVDSLLVNLTITGPAEFTPLDTTIVIKSGLLDVLEIKTIELIDSLDIFFVGTYNVAVSISNGRDTIPDNDSIESVYYNTRIALPLEEDFDYGIPGTVFSSTGNTADIWKSVSKGTDADSVVTAFSGAQMIAFGGSRGAIGYLSTKQIQLSRTRLPKLEFWYFHDTVESEDYTDVRITIDGAETYIPLLSLTKQNSKYGWTFYEVDLSPYTNGNCVSILFESMEKTISANTVQYIDKIRIISQPDLELSKLILSEIDVCDLTLNELKISRTTTTNQIIDFTKYLPDIVVDIAGAINYSFTYALTDTLEGDMSDTLLIASNISLIPGTYTITAYLNKPVDEYNVNDTIVKILTVNPTLSVNVKPESTPNCLSGELIMYPTITLYNTGNMDLSNMDMILEVDTGENNPAVYNLFKETYTGNIHAGDTVTYTFNNFYRVPWNARYNVRATVYLNCDSLLVHTTNMITECVDTKDLRMMSIDNPSGAKDATGSSVQVTATLNNRSDGDIFSDIPVTVRITNSQGAEQESFMELQTIGASETVSHTFSRSYTVPNDSVYYITVFVENRDNYRNNDTLTTKRYTESVGIETLNGANTFTLGQNIPNPAKNHTHIDYTVPESGEVIFYVHSVSGQLLYSKTIEAVNGKQTLELNTSTFAAGIYFYSMEYKGQRIVKRMMISGRVNK